MASNSDRAQRWIDVALGRTHLDNLAPSGTVYAVGDTVYSYGRHFPMAEVMRDKNGEPSWILVNGDRYSVTTSGHQGMIRGIVRDSGLPSVILPHEALRGAGIDPDSIQLIEVRNDRIARTDHESADKPGENHVTERIPEDHCAMLDDLNADEPTWRRSVDLRKSRIMLARDSAPDPNRVYVGRSNWLVAERGADGIWRWETTAHLLGDSLFSAKVRGQRGRRVFLSSFDYQEATPLYYLCELPRGAEAYSVGQGIDSLKPEAVRAAEDAGLMVTRQGDLFAIPTELTTKEVKRQTPHGKGKIVKRAAVLGTNHEPSEVMFGTRGRVYARGTLYHAPGQWRDPDHVRRRMGDGRTWHILARNTVPRVRDRATV